MPDNRYSNFEYVGGDEVLMTKRRLESAKRVFTPHVGIKKYRVFGQRGCETPGQV